MIRTLSKVKKIAIGEKMCIYRDRLSNKLSPMWAPGYTIKQHIPPDAFVVSNDKSTLRLNKAHIRHDWSDP